MKIASIVLVLLVAGYLWYQHLEGPAVSGPPVVKDPWYAEIRAAKPYGGREVEFAMFARALDESDCVHGAQAGWANITKACPSCIPQPPKCMKELAPRYSRLFDDAPNPSVYLSATAASPRERDLRLVLFGLTDEEGMVACEQIRKELEKNYSGPLQCVEPSK